MIKVSILILVLSMAACGEKNSKKANDTSKYDRSSSIEEEKYSNDALISSDDSDNSPQNDTRIESKANLTIAIPELNKEENRVKVVTYRNNREDSFIFNIGKSENIEIRDLDAGKSTFKIILLDSQNEQISSESLDIQLESGSTKSIEIKLKEPKKEENINVVENNTNKNYEVWEEDPRSRKKCFFDEEVKSLTIKLKGTLVTENSVSKEIYNKLKNNSNSKDVSIKLSRDTVFNKINLNVINNNEFNSSVTYNKPKLDLRNLNQITVFKEGFTFETEEKCLVRKFLKISSEECSKNTKEYNGYKVSELKIFANNKRIYVKNFIQPKILNHKSSSFTISKEELESNDFYKKILSSSECK